MVCHWIRFMREPHAYHNFPLPGSLFLLGVVPINPLWDMLGLLSFKTFHKFRNFIVCDMLKASLRVICDPSSEFHLSWNENFIPSRSEWRGPGKDTWPQSHPCADLTAQCCLAFSSFLNPCIISFWICCLACCSFLIPSSILELISSLRFTRSLWLPFISCLRLSTLPITSLTFQERPKQGQDFSIAFVRVSWTCVALYFRPTDRVFHRGIG